MNGNILVKLLMSSDIRWNNYKDNNRKNLRGDELKQTGLFTHFKNLDHNGFLEDTETTFIDRKDPSNPTRREEFWTDTLNSLSAGA